ncbi:DNA recombination protein RmuC [Sphingobacterium mizutaii NBRC 14946 = DSM 11724]|uniref:DNA recombination protein rmuC n=2 Tax=Sphingobacterium mizutaii TaxID=1010 RepID=A0AAJ4XEA5_9SPHI|nr:DNA recombination protein RmuC [Sphingobacterium mizutaii]GEM68272.1 DNA recombination protein RmuC [Sphingobacterium mizutaii NBRC 14946 = DSM 11724]SDL80972.1 DNA recombination protein RmuC [Sphingobacterium mizutaii]SNV59573.1 DNA recombination protein rmuC [Sphingobacterium mizutaii]
MEVIYLVSLIVLVAICAILVWRNARAVSREEHNRALDASKDLQVEFAKIQERERILMADRDRLSLEMKEESLARQSVERSLEGTNAYLQAQQEKFAEQRQEMENMKVQFNNEFQVMANKILEEKSFKFTQLNQQNISLVLDPLKEKIKTFEEKVEKSYQQESAERNVLKGVVEQLMQQSMQIKDEANNLAKALKGDNKKQGNWGEVILERVLERSGLIKDQEYKLQASVQEADGRRFQPDALIYLPDEKHLVVDAKLSLVAYERAVNADTEEDRVIFVKQHVQSIENHVRELSAKDYHSLYGIQSPDFVLLFIPIESSLSLAVNFKPELFSEAWDRRVVIVSPSTLLATLRTIASVWKQERQNRNVLEIAKEAGLLYDKFVGFLNDMDQLQGMIQKAADKHDEAMKKLSSGSGNVIRKIEQLKTLGAKANKQIGDKYLED